jgi:hypothetical protein
VGRARPRCHCRVGAVAVDAVCGDHHPVGLAGDQPATLTARGRSGSVCRSVRGRGLLAAVRLVAAVVRRVIWWVVGRRERASGFGAEARPFPQHGEAVLGASRAPRGEGERRLRVVNPGKTVPVLWVSNLPSPVPLGVGRCDL